MAETLISPGVLARENDQSQVTQGPISVGAAIIGPAVKGPVGIPTLVTSYSDYQNRFGTTFTSGGAVYSFFTSIAAYNYFNNGGESLLVTRVASGSFTPASSSDIVNTIQSTAGAFAVGSTNLSSLGNPINIEFRILDSSQTTYRFLPTSSGNYSDDIDGKLYFFASGSTIANTLTNISNKINSISSTLGLQSLTSTTTLILSGSTSGSTYNNYTFQTGSGTDFLSLITLGGGIDGIGSNAFTLETLNVGIETNNSGSELTGGILVSGSQDNVRWQIVSPDTSSGTFTLLIRRGDDNTSTPTILETWSNLSLDPFSSNYIEAVIGNQIQQVRNDGSTFYVQTAGSYVNKSRYIRVKSVNSSTPNYLNSLGSINSASNGTPFSRYIPLATSGTFAGAAGKIIVTGGQNYYESIPSSTGNIQGVGANDYTQSIALLSNQDDYKYNLLVAPGLNTGNAASQITSIISNCQNRGDAIAVIDVAAYNAQIGTVTNNASTYNNSYAATYWPWLQTIDPDSGKQVWVPASTMIPGVYAFNDRVSEPWFAPAGINRGGLSTVIQAERKIPQSDRDTLYLANVNPIATFPGTGVVVYGQKTLQKAASALDRVNVRRLLIALKSYITQVSLNLVFEQNTAATRNNFLSQVNPYLESVQQRQGLYAFKVVMDDTNNTADVIDRNQLVGQIYLQPTKTAEFILLDFNILPTGATFG
jgi:phage tail sheath protein FI